MAEGGGRQGHEAGQGAVLEDEVHEGPSDLKVPCEALALEEGEVQMGRAPEEPVEQGQREGLPRGVGEPRVGPYGFVGHDGAEPGKAVDPAVVKQETVEALFPDAVPEEDEVRVGEGRGVGRDVMKGAA